ncbi:MAG: hypothetical protein IT326_03980, partial [Anaerolineae bacterium]|nr:hypothetical protein [Anaerolineae bacterium]
YCVVIPVLGVLLTGPWALRVLPLFFVEQVVSPFILSATHWKQMVVYQGVLVPALALGGAMLALWRRRLPDVLMLTWLVFVIDFSIFGLTDRFFDLIGIDIMRYVYPYSVAWRGPILTYAYFATVFIDWLLDRWAAAREHAIAMPMWAGQAALVTGIGLVALAVVLSRPILISSRQAVNFFGAFSSRADLAVMTYLRQNSPQDSLILNYPSGFEGHWVTTIAERETVEFRDQPFFHLADSYYERMAQAEQAYFDLSQPAARVFVQAQGIDYVIIPQIVNQPERFNDMRGSIRWRWPQDTWRALDYDPASIDWLEQVFEQDGAQVYRVLP